MQQFLKSSVGFLKIHKRVFMILGFFLLTFIVVPQVDAQGALKISSLSEIESKAKEGSDTMKNLAIYVIGAVLALALVFVIWALSSNNPHGKEYFIGWIVAVVVYLVAIAII